MAWQIERQAITASGHKHENAAARRNILLKVCDIFEVVDVQKRVQARNELLEAALDDAALILPLEEVSCGQSEAPHGEPDVVHLCSLRLERRRRLTVDQTCEMNRCHAISSVSSGGCATWPSLVRATVRDCVVQRCKMERAIAIPKAESVETTRKTVK